PPPLPATALLPTVQEIGYVEQPCALRAPGNFVYGDGLLVMVPFHRLASCIRFGPLVGSSVQKKGTAFSHYPGYSGFVNADRRPLVNGNGPRLAWTGRLERTQKHHGAALAVPCHVMLIGNEVRQKRCMQKIAMADGYLTAHRIRQRLVGSDTTLRSGEITAAQDGASGTGTAHGDLFLIEQVVDGGFDPGTFPITDIIGLI